MNVNVKLLKKIVPILMFLGVRSSNASYNKQFSFRNSFDNPSNSSDIELSSDLQEGSLSKITLKVQEYLKKLEKKIPVKVKSFPGISWNIKVFRDEENSIVIKALLVVVEAALFSFLLAACFLVFPSIVSCIALSYSNLISGLRLTFYTFFLPVLITISIFLAPFYNRKEENPKDEDEDEQPTKKGNKDINQSKTQFYNDDDETFAST